MSVPFIDLKRYEPGFLDNWYEKVQQLSKNTAFIGGSEVATIEENIKRNCQVEYAISCANGTDALQIALRAVGVDRNDFVLLPDATFWATFEAIVNVGANPVPVDISEDDLQMDFDLFVQAAEKYKPKAAILVHLYGWGSSRIEDFRSYCTNNNIKLIEDGAQSYGVNYNNESIYKNALVSTISFYPAKVYGAAGDAGAIATSNEELSSKIRSICNHGRSEHYSYQFVGWNSRMDTLQAAFLNLIQPHLADRIKSRQKSALWYRTELQGSDDFKHIKVPNRYIENGYLNCLIIKSEKRDAICDHLKSKETGFGIVYPEPMSIQLGAQPYLQEKFHNPVALKLSKCVLSLPLFANMTEDELYEVKTVFLEAIEKS